MDLYSYCERYWYAVVVSGTLVFLASIIAAPLWR